MSVVSSSVADEQADSQSRLMIQRLAHGNYRSATSSVVSISDICCDKQRINFRRLICCGYKRRGTASICMLLTSRLGHRDMKLLSNDR